MMKSENRYSVCSRLLHAITFFVPSFVVVAALPEIEQSSVEFRQVNTKATISYELKNAPAIVTVDIETNTLADASGEWVSIGGGNLKTLSGDVHKVVRTGARKITWQSRAEWPEMKIPAGQIRAVLTAWATNAPPDYLVIGLDANNDVRLYAKPDFVPYGIGSNYYKTNAILMRKIPAAGVTWRMGSYEGEDANRSENEVPHLVMLTADYYMGVYELTQGQLKKIHAHTSDFAGYEDSPMRPANKLNIETMRGWGDEYWPDGGYETVKEKTVIALLRKKCGLAQIDLPTEAQWEFACRAGTDTAFNNGGASSKECIESIGWYTWNSDVDGDKQPHAVGAWPSNGFGLYDMHGNIAELCLGRWSDDYKKALGLPADYDGNRGIVVVDPLGAPSENNDNESMLTRGGAYERSFVECRSAARLYYSNTKEYARIGCRLCAPAVFK